LSGEFFVFYERVEFIVLLAAWAVPDCVEGLSRAMLRAVYVQTEFCIGSQSASLVFAV